MLVVYLDSQDYIKIFNEAEGGENRKVLERLMYLKNQGLITIGFSAITLLEFVTEPDEKHRQERISRGKLIKDICGPNAFPMVNDLGSGARFPNGENWLFPEGKQLISASKMLRQLSEEYESAIRGHKEFNRKTKRSFLKKNSLKKIVLENGFGRKVEHYGTIPVSKDFVDGRYIEKLILGKISKEDFEKRVNLCLLDPEEYSRIVYDYYKKENMIDAYFSETKKNMHSAVVKLQNHVRKVKEFNSLISGSRAKMIASGMDKMEVRKRTKAVTLDDPFPDGLLNLESSLGSGRSAHFVHYFRKLASLSVSYKESDTMDLWQFCYAYDCDFFRCDKAMADTFKDFKPFEGKLIGRFADLPNRIEEKLSIKNS